jgi:8-oxo-dGTP pyrophosphatase MutT (NUDIX family)
MKFYESGEYRATKNWPYAIAAGGVVYRENGDNIEVLLLFRKAGEFPELIDGHLDSYHLPKGHIRLDEQIDHAAKREIAEEAGCEVSIETYLGARVNQYIDNSIQRDKIIHYFAAKWIEDLGAIDHEHSSRLWVTIDKAVVLLGSTNPKREDTIIERLKKFLELSR